MVYHLLTQRHYSKSFWLKILNQNINGFFQDNNFGLDNGLAPNSQHAITLTHWGRVTNINVSKLTIIGSDNGLVPTRQQVIIWTNARILSTWSSGTNFSEISIKIHTFSFKKMHLTMSSAKWRPFCLGKYVLIIDSWWPIPLTYLECYGRGQEITSHEYCCVRSRYQGQGYVITSYSICGVTVIFGLFDGGCSLHR